MDSNGHITETRLTLLICLLLSLAAHLVILPGVGAGTGRSDADALQRPQHEPFQHEPLRTLSPGIDAPTPARITWIGYDEALEHLINPAKQDQAAMELGGETRASTGATPSATTRPAPFDPEQAVQEAVSLATALREAIAQGRGQAADLSQFLREAADAMLAQAERAARAQQQALAALQPAERQHESQEVEAAAAGETQGASDSSDRAADPTSDEPEIIDVRLGKPVARQGVEIRTTKPHVSVVTRWASLHMRSPVMRLDFRSDGSVEKVTVLQSTGYKQVDQDLIDCLYEWTAKGSQLESLRPKQTLPFVVRIEPS